ncbi:MAG: hypothetical protein MZW92_03865 [Comamonadaceae bacterium]|nr:hypothetical protein [Comamonadaceae bacterium]
MSQVLSSRQRVTAMSFQRLYPPPAFVIITWYLPFDSSCTSGMGVSGLLKDAHRRLRTAGSRA